MVKCLISSKSCFIVLIAQEKKNPCLQLKAAKNAFVHEIETICATYPVSQPASPPAKKNDFRKRVACVLLCRTQLSCFFFFLNFYHNITSFTRHRNEMEAIQNGSLDSDDDIFLY